MWDNGVNRIKFAIHFCLQFFNNLHTIAISSTFHGTWTKSQIYSTRKKKSFVLLNRQNSDTWEDRFEAHVKSFKLFQVRCLSRWQIFVLIKMILHISIWSRFWCTLCQRYYLYKSDVSHVQGTPFCQEIGSSKQREALTYRWIIYVGARSFPGTFIKWDKEIGKKLRT